MQKIQEKPEKEKLITIKEMAVLMKVDERTLIEWVQHRRIPYVLVDKKFIRFRLSDIADWINKNQLLKTLKEKRKTTASHS
jgi:excisionase family DNA binding protein